MSETMQRVGVIRLTNGGFTVVDPDLPASIMSRAWRGDIGGYVTRNGRQGSGRQKTVFLHKEIAGSIGPTVDHKNRDKLDNRRGNLRAATQSQNSANVAKRDNLSSRYKGVTFDRNRGKWKAMIKINYKAINIGRFIHEADAAEAYNKAALEQWGEFAVLNQVTSEHASFRRSARRLAFKRACVTGEAE